MTNKLQDEIDKFSANISGCFEGAMNNHVEQLQKLHKSSVRFLEYLRSDKRDLSRCSFSLLGLRRHKRDRPICGTGSDGSRYSLSPSHYSTCCYEDVSGIDLFSHFAIMLHDVKKILEKIFHLLQIVFRAQNMQSSFFEGKLTEFIQNFNASVVNCFDIDLDHEIGTISENMKELLNDCGKTSTST